MSQHAATSYLALDLGATSGRAVLGTLERGVMRTREVHRFPTPMTEVNGHLHWDVQSLQNEVIVALANALAIDPFLRSISVDSWAVDYVPLTSIGTIARPPYAYRDPRTKGRLDALLRRISPDALYAQTGTQFLEFNTLSQVIADLADEPEIVASTASRLLIADYFLYQLSGAAIAERTMASTTQLYDVRHGGWASALIDSIGDAASRWPRIVEPGTVLGPVLSRALPAGQTHRPFVIATCSHDTAAAVAAIPADDAERWVYISSGTWSLVGAELAAPQLTSAARTAGFTNEMGWNDTVRFLKNCTGMWVLEECAREWAAGGDVTSPEQWVNAAAESSSLAYTIDLNAAPFQERGDMVAKVHAACRAAGQPLPRSRGEFVRLVLESLAERYRSVLAELAALTGRTPTTIHVVGGGARNTLLNQLTADACQCRVVAGPSEAAVLGNLLVQARAMGDLPLSESVRAAARRSSETTEYLPTPHVTAMAYADM